MSEYNVKRVVITEKYMKRLEKQREDELIRLRVRVSKLAIKVANMANNYRVAYEALFKKQKPKVLLEKKLARLERIEKRLCDTLGRKALTMKNRSKDGQQRYFVALTPNEWNNIEQFFSKKRKVFEYRGDKQLFYVSKEEGMKIRSMLRRKEK